MCENCYIEYGSPKVINEKVKMAAELIREVYDCEHGGAGGYGHIVFDDWNLGDGNVDSCIEDAIKGEYDEHIGETKMASIKALEFFKTLSIDERATALALYDGFIKQPSS